MKNYDIVGTNGQQIVNKWVCADRSLESIH